MAKPDALGYLQTAYGTYDAMLTESIRALNQRILTLESANAALLQQFDALRAEVQSLKAGRVGK